MWWRSLPIALVVAVAASLGASANEPARASAPAAVIGSLSVSAKTRAARVDGRRLLVVTSVTVTGIDNASALAIRCTDCRRLRRTRIVHRRSATSRKYIGMYWVLPRGRGISVDVVAVGRVGRWTVLGPGRRNRNRLVFKGSGCLRPVKRVGGRRPQRLKCPAGTAPVAPADSPVPTAPAPVTTPPAPAPPPAPPPAPAPAPPPPPPPPPFQVCCTHTFEAAANQAIVSPNGRYELRMQSDGNLVLYSRPAYNPLWQSGTSGSGATRAVMQSDGNLVVYRGGTPLWQSQTSGYPSATLVMQDDGNAVIYHNGVARWSTGTSGRA